MCCIRISYPSSPPRNAAEVSLSALGTVASSNWLASLARHFPPQATVGGARLGMVAVGHGFRTNSGVVMVMEGRLGEPTRGLVNISRQRELMQ